MALVLGAIGLAWGMALWNYAEDHRWSGPRLAVTFGAVYCVWLAITLPIALRGA